MGTKKNEFFMSRHHILPYLQVGYYRSRPSTETQVICKENSCIAEMLTDLARAATV
jgi:hypothetical protein